MLERKNNDFNMCSAVYISQSGDKNHAGSKWMLSTVNQHKCQCNVFHSIIIQGNIWIFCDIDLFLHWPLFCK